METIEYKALVNYGPEGFRLETREVAGISDDEILLKVCGCGICAADTKMYNGVFYLPAPVAIGHEFYGSVAAMGAGAAKRTGLSEGDFIAVEQIIPCGECRFCKGGQYWMCERHAIHGFVSGFGEGGMAEYVVLGKQSIVYKLPINAPDPIWSLVEPLGCAIHAVSRAGIEPEDTVVLAGLGPIGLLMLQVIMQRKPRLVIALDTYENRLNMGVKFGADLVLNPASEDVVARVKDLTGGYGCDRYIHCSGNENAVAQGLSMLRRLGTYVEFSVFAKPATADWTIVGDGKELNIFGSHLSPYTYPDAIDFIGNGSLDARSVISHVFSLEEYEQAFKTAAKRDECLRVVLVP